MKKLKKKERKFAQHYVDTNCNIIKAAKLAGYDLDDYGYMIHELQQLLKRKDVDAFIKQLQQERNAKAAIDIIYAIEKLEAVYEKAMEINPRTEAPNSLNAANKAIDQIIKLKGLYSQLDVDATKLSDSVHRVEIVLDDGAKS